MHENDIDAVRNAAFPLLLAWARSAAPHYGPSGSMDLDLLDFPDAEGPSYYNQFAHFAFLLLSEGIVPGADEEERARFREIALANLDYVLAITDADFHTPHYSRGRDWGRHVGEWINYYALRSLDLMQRHDVGPPELRTRLSAAILGAVTHLVQRLTQRFGVDGPVRFPGNHATWHGLLAWEAGVFFERDDWCDWARGFFERWVLATQRPDGVWPEGEGIVVNYSMVTAQAVSLYAESADCEPARRAMERALGFFQFFNLPDGTSAVAADCRMRHHGRPMVFFPPTFLRSAEGRALCVDRIRTFTSSLARDGLNDNGAQGLAFYATFVAALADWNAGEDSVQSVQPEDLPVARAEAGPWTVFLSWQLVPENPSRFIIDTQNFLELYHTESGYLIGTGNSKYAPRFSTVRRVSGNRAYIPDRAVCLEQASDHVACEYAFGDDRIRIESHLHGAEVVIRVLADPTNTERYEVALILALSPGDVLRIDDRDTALDPDAMVNESFGEGGSFVWKNRTFTVPSGTRLEYPLIPHNPYTQNGLPAPDGYVGRLGFPAREEAALVRIR